MTFFKFTISDDNLELTISDDSLELTISHHWMQKLCTRLQDYHNDPQIELCKKLPIDNLPLLYNFLP